MAKQSTNTLFTALVEKKKSTKAPRRHFAIKVDGDLAITDLVSLRDANKMAEYLQRNQPKADIVIGVWKNS